MAHSGERWQEGERGMLVAKLRDLCTIEEIAKVLERSEAGVRLQIRNMVQAGRDAGKTREEIAYDCGLSLHDVQVILGDDETIEDRVTALEAEVASLKKIIAGLARAK